MLINCEFCGEKSRALMLTDYENTFYFGLFIAFNNFFSNGHRFTCNTFTGKCATIPPQVDAIFNLGN